MRKVLVAAGWLLLVLLALPLHAALTMRCQWGAGVNAPVVAPASTNVIMMPIVAEFGGPARIAFISYGSGADLNRDGGGTLRIVDVGCKEVARFPDPNVSFPVPAGCPANLYSHTLAPTSGLAAGDIDGTPDIEIIAVLDHPTLPTHGQLVALALSNGQLQAKWCSQQLPPGDFIPPTSAPAIAHLDDASVPGRQIIIDNKVYNSNGALRFTGFSHLNNCASAGGSPCPRSRTAIVANLPVPASRPKVITGRGVYRPLNVPAWNFASLTVIGTVTNNNSVHPAVAELDPTSAGPEIVVVDPMASTLRVLAGFPPYSQLASIVLSNNVIHCPGLACKCPGPQCPKCGGPPMIADVDGAGGVEIGVATCFAYSVYKYNAGTLATLWFKSISDPSGQTTSTIINTSTGKQIFYADTSKLWVFKGQNGQVLQTLANASSTAIEGPTLAGLGAPSASLVVSANGTSGGIRIFDDPSFSPAYPVMNQHTYHMTNVTGGGIIPAVELPSWISRNSYRAQQYP